METETEVVWKRTGDEIGISKPYFESQVKRCFADAFTGTTLDNRAFVALYPGVGRAFHVACIDRTTRRIVWVSDVWGVRYGFFSGSPTIHYVELSAKGGSVAVFGAEVCGMYIQSFDIRTGATLFRFCTTYWGNPSERWAAGTK